MMKKLRNDKFVKPSGIKILLVYSIVVTCLLILKTQNSGENLSKKICNIAEPKL